MSSAPVAPAPNAGKAPNSGGMLGWLSGMAKSVTGTTPSGPATGGGSRRKKRGSGSRKKRRGASRNKRRGASRRRFMAYAPMY